MATAERLIRIRSYNREILLVQATFDKETYNPGDTVNGQLTVNRTDGVAFTDSDKLSFSYVINFGDKNLSDSDIDIPIDS
jgi:hypothetical protein